MVSDILCRAVLNLLRLLIVLEGHVPMSKHDVRQRLPSTLRDPSMVAAAEIALRVHHEDRFSTLGEAQHMIFLWCHLRPRLVVHFRS